MGFGRTFVLAIALLVAMSVVLKLPAAAEWGTTFARAHVDQVAALLAALPPADEIDTILDSGTAPSSVKKEAAKTAESIEEVTDETEGVTEQTIEISDSEEDPDVTIETTKCTCPKGAAQCAECSTCGSVKWTDEPAQEGKELPKTNLCYKKEGSCIVPEGGSVCSALDVSSIEDALKKGGSVGYTPLGSMTPQRLTSPTDPIIQSIYYQNLFTDTTSLFSQGNFSDSTWFSEWKERQNTYGSVFGRLGILAPSPAVGVSPQSPWEVLRTFGEPGSLSPSQSVIDAAFKNAQNAVEAIPGASTIPGVTFVTGNYRDIFGKGPNILELRNGVTQSISSAYNRARSVVTNQFNSIREGFNNLFSRTEVGEALGGSGAGVEIEEGETEIITPRPPETEGQRQTQTLVSHVKNYCDKFMNGTAPGVCEQTLLSMAHFENGFRCAVGVSSANAKGCFQYIDSTWQVEREEARRAACARGDMADTCTLLSSNPSQHNPEAVSAVVAYKFSQTYPGMQAMATANGVPLQAVVQMCHFGDGYCNALRDHPNVQLSAGHPQARGLAWNAFLRQNNLAVGACADMTCSPKEVAEIIVSGRYQGSMACARQVLAGDFSRCSARGGVGTVVDNVVGGFQQVTGNVVQGVGNILGIGQQGGNPLISQIVSTFTGNRTGTSTPGTGKGGSTQQTATSTSNRPQFSCNPDTIVNGNEDTVTIAWTCSDSTTSTGVGFTAGPASGSVEVRPDETDSQWISYEIQCGNETKRSCLVEVLHPVVTIVAAAAVVEAGGETQLAWTGVDVEACAVLNPEGKAILTGARSSGRLPVQNIQRGGAYRVVCVTETDARVEDSVSITVIGDGALQSPVDSTITPEEIRND